MWLDSQSPLHLCILRYTNVNNAADRAILDCPLKGICISLQNGTKFKITEFNVEKYSDKEPIKFNSF
jgi:hypothetical protein